MKRFILLYMLWLAGLSAAARSGRGHVAAKPDAYTAAGDTLSPTVAPPNLFLKTNVFSLLEPDAAATLALSWRRTKNMAYQLEAGYIFNDNLENQDYLMHTRGIRIKPEWRYYVPRPSAGRYHYTNYWAVEAIIKSVHNEIYRFVSRGCSSGNCAYYQEMSYHTSRNVLGIAGKIGWQTYIGSKANRFILDVYSGFGMRYSRVTNSLPPDAEIPRKEHLFISINRATGLSPYIAMGVKIGWRIK